MKLRLNLSTAPLPNKRPFLAGAVLAGVFGILALVILSHAAYRSWHASRALRTDTAYWQNELRESKAKQRELGTYFQTPGARQVLSRAGFLNSLINERSFPWTKVFVDLEHTLPAGVRIVSISPDLENGRAKVKLTFGALTEDGKIKFLEALEKSKAFSDLEVQGEKPASQVGSGRPDQVEVELTAWYETL